MAQLYPVAGARFFMGPAVTVVPDDPDVNAALFASTAWTEVKGWQTMGSVGDSATLISEDIINSGRTLKAKGTKNAGSMQNNFIVQPYDEGQEMLIAAANSSANYQFRIMFDDAPPAAASVVTITVASPGVISWANHGRQNGDPIKFSTTGALPTGLVAGTTYYVVSAASGTFSVAATPGGAAIATTGTQSGVHTATAVTAPTTKYFYGIVMSSQEQGGGANTARLISGTVEINSPVITVAPVGGA